MRQTRRAVIVFNPLIERGHQRFTNPQNAAEMLVKPSTQISSQYHQIKVGGDKAALMSLCKAVLEMDDAAREMAGERILDLAFINEHTHGFEEFEKAVRGTDWAELERRSGLTRQAIQSAAAVYAQAKRAMIAYGMGLTQQVGGVENVQMIINLLLLRGNIGKPGAGVLPVRGHSNLQGQRTVGITEKPELVPNDKLKELYGFEPPKDKGLNCVEAAEGVIKGEVRAVFQLGGNLARSLPDHGQLLPAWRRLRLTVQILTKPNRSCLEHGEVSYILPWDRLLGRNRWETSAEP
jgi:anaerobic selenocysteine-containing dehydrogenase